MIRAQRIQTQTRAQKRVIIVFHKKKNIIRPHPRKFCGLKMTKFYRHDDENKRRKLITMKFQLIRYIDQNINI